MKESLYGPCGLYCGACGATDCTGCPSPGAGNWVAKCRLKSCAEQKGVEFCCFCGDYPCPELQAFMTDEWPHHRTVATNLEQIRREGRDSWLRTQRRIWSCPGCGAPTMWYQKECGCGRRLDGWDLPYDLVEQW
jgi:hypothetical protein